MPENQTVWKSDNQGVKEETFNRWVGRAEMGRWGREDTWQGGSRQTKQSHICMWINQEEQLGS